MTKRKRILNFVFAAIFFTNFTAFGSPTTIPAKIDDSNGSNPEVNISDDELANLWENHKKLLKEEGYYTQLRKEFDVITKSMQFIIKTQKEQIASLRSQGKYQEASKSEAELSLKIEAMRTVKTNLMNKYKNLYTNDANFSTPEAAENRFRDNFNEFVYGDANLPDYLNWLLSTKLSTYSNSERSVTYQLYLSRLKLIEKDKSFSKLLPIYEESQRMIELKQELTKIEVIANQKFSDYTNANNKSRTITISAGFLSAIAIIAAVGLVGAPVALIYGIIGIFSTVFLFHQYEKISNARYAPFPQILSIFFAGTVAWPFLLSRLIGKKISREDEVEAEYNKAANIFFAKEKEFQEFEKSFKEKLLKSSNLTKAIDDAVLAGRPKSAMRLLTP